MNKPNNQSTLDTWVDWLLHLHAQEIDLGLTRIAEVTERMGLKRPALVVITVAGTNGKGSSVAMLSSILKEAGYQVGTYTSPHIISFTERVQVNGKPVTEQEIVDAFTDIEQQRADTKLTYFEFSTLAALKVFKAHNLDVVVLVVWLGGRLDAVNVVDADATLITAIYIDHVDWLGDDRSVIATEKAGVMRKHQISVCSDPDVPKSLIDHANALAVDLSVLNRDFSYAEESEAWRLRLSDTEKGFVKPALKGVFQLQNAAGVVTLLNKISGVLPVEIDTINRGLANVRHPGRLELRKIGHQDWLIDVAHNPQSAKVLADYLKQNDLDGQLAIFSALNDKDMLPMVKALSPYISDWYIADLNIPRASSVQRLTEMLLQAGVDKSHIHAQDTIKVAVKSVTVSASDRVLVWGSFFTVAQTLQCLEGEHA